MNIVDWVLIGVLIVFAWAGWRQGFMAGLLSFVGFIGGGLLAAFILPDVIVERTDPGFIRVAVLAISIILCAILGQLVTSFLGRRLRGGLTWRPVRFIDSLAGAALNVLGVAIVGWIVVSAVAYLPESSVTTNIRQSSVLIGLDKLVPDIARNTFANLRDSVSATAVPRVFSGLAEFTGPDVNAPDAKTAESSGIQAARASIVRVTGDSKECLSELSGSGFVVAAGYVLTNAHVVAGVDEPRVRGGNQGEYLTAKVVAFDPKLDVAVLLVPKLRAEPLNFVKVPAASGDAAVAAGFPGGGDFTATPARIRAAITARGDDIYGRAGVERKLYAFRGLVRPGNSGGPLLNPDGEVLGMVFGAGVGDSDTGYAITAPQLAAAIKRGITRADEVNTGPCNP
ncbi:MAG: MarP family serine protease [Candidatus Nanopelagicales bacterium]|nr:MarP family serine protease [Candidatus Nanopelagicales bacterium]